MNTSPLQFYQDLETTRIPLERKKILDQLISYISQKSAQNKPIRLNFICTHNSRRSQFAQVWSTVAGKENGFNIHSFSGGVEITEANPRTIESLKNVGFEVKMSGKENPEYELRWTEEEVPIILFSKLYDHPSSPTSEFAAIMTCSEADENCPFIPGAEVRISLPYNDPKAFDDTPEESEQYLTTSTQIATEIKYVFEQIPRHGTRK